MQTRSDAEEHLRIIRSLMEKATIYRAISAEAAAVGGVLAIGGSFATGNWLKPTPYDPGIPSPSAPAFLGPWIGLLVLTSLVNLYFLRRAATQRVDRFISPGMRLALAALLPSFFVAGGLTIYFAGLGPNAVFIVPIWIVCYGIGLLATSHFAPRSLVYLGWAFLLAGLGAFWPMFDSSFAVRSGQYAGPWCVAQILMASTFGLFHLIYAACTWPRRARGADAGGTP